MSPSAPVRSDRREPCRKGCQTAYFLSLSLFFLKHPKNVTLFAKKKKQNGEGGLPPSPPHLLLACKNRFYLEVRDCA